MTSQRILAAIVTLAVAAAVVTAFVVTGSPAQERARRLDQQRAQDLQQLNSVVDQFVQQNNRLPATLDETRRTPAAMALPPLADPKTGQPYEYRVKDENTYELCATFETVADSSDRMKPAPLYPPYTSNFWDHAAGQTCFDLHPNRPQMK